MAKKEKSKSKGRRYQKEALMERMKKSQQQQEGGLGVLRSDANVTIWRPKDGSHIIDIIPYIVGKNNVEGDKPGKGLHYTFRYFVHKSVGPNNDWHICPARTWGEDCPICEYRQKLIDKGEDWDSVIKPLFPRSRNIYNVVCYDRGEEKKGVQVWDISNHYFEKHILTLSKKPARSGKAEKNILFFDEEEGKSITFTIEPAQGKDDYPEYVGHAFDERDYKISDEILDAAHCLDELIVRPNYQDLEKAFFGKSGSKNKAASKDEGPGWADDEEENEEEENVNWEMLIDELDDLEDMDMVESFIEGNSIDIDFKKLKKKKLKVALREVRKYLEEMSEKEEEDEDKENDDEDEDKEEELTAEDIEEMSKKELRKLIKERELDIDVKDFDDLDDLKDEVISELELDE